MSKSVTIISKNNCPACESAKSYFKEQGMTVKDFNINTHKRKREIAEIYRNSGSPGLPLVLLDYGRDRAEKVVGNRTDKFKAFIGG